MDNPKAWLFTVANNLMIDANRGDQHVKDLDETAWGKVDEATSGSEADPEKQVL